MNDLNGKIALVTGASRGLGRDIALALAQCGCDIAVAYRSDAAAASTVLAEIEALGRKTVAFAANLANADAARELVHSVQTELGPVDVLVNNAGINPARPLEELTAVDWDETMAVNLSSVFHVTQAALPAMRSRRWGRIINISSVAAQIGGVIGPHYAASKAGMIGLTHYYAAALAKEGVTANAIAPALIETDMIKGNPNIKPTLIPVGRFGQSKEVASVAVMLAQNGYMTGQTINVNGGWYMS